MFYLDSEKTSMLVYIDYISNLFRPKRKPTDLNYDSFSTTCLF